MSEISEHDGEEEREGDDGEESWVDLLVGSDSVGVDDGLESLGEPGCSMEGGRGEVGSKFRKDGRDRGSGGFLGSRRG